MKAKTEYMYVLLKMQPDPLSFDNIYVYWVVKLIHKSDSSFDTYIAKKHIKAQDRDSSFAKLLELQDDEFNWTDLAECIF